MPVSGLHSVTSFRSVSGSGRETGDLVVPAGTGLVAAAPRRPAEMERQAGQGQAAALVFAGEVEEPAGLSGRQQDRRDAGRAGLADGGRHRRIPGVDPQVIPRVGSY